MLNPSTADADADDPTIRRCIGFARDAGYGGLEVGNLFAFRATDPTKLREVSDPIGPENDVALAEIYQTVALVVCAWGGDGKLHDRGRRVLEAMRTAGLTPHCLKMTMAGFPAHPLYLPKLLRPMPMS